MKKQTIIKRLDLMLKEISEHPGRLRDMQVNEAYMDLVFRLHYLGDKETYERYLAKLIELKYGVKER